MSALTIKTSPHTDTHHALDRSGTRALCRSNLTPHTWLTRGDSDEMVERSAIYRQSGDTFKRSCSRSRVNCLGCQRKLAQELVYAVETAKAWQAVLLGMAGRQNRPVAVVSLRSIGVAWDMVVAGYMEQVGTEYALTALGLRAAGVVRAAEEQAHRWNDTMHGLSKLPGGTASLKGTDEYEAAHELVEAGYGFFSSGLMLRVTLTGKGNRATGKHLGLLAEVIGDKGRRALVQYASRGRNAVLISQWYLLARHGLAAYSGEGDHEPTGLAYRLLGYLRSRPEAYGLPR